MIGKTRFAAGKMDADTEKWHQHLADLEVIRPEIVTPLTDAMGFVDGDEWAIEIGEQIPVGDPFRNWSLGISYGFAGRHDQAQSVINAMSVNATPRDQLHIALAYAAMGEIEQAVAWMNVAYESRADWLPWVVHPHAYGGSVEPLREHAGFKAIVDQMVIPAAQPTGH